MSKGIENAAGCAANDSGVECAHCGVRLLPDWAGKFRFVYRSAG